MRLFSFFTLSVFFAWSTAAAAPFGPGEKLTYSITFTGGVKAGEMQMDLHENPRAGGPKAYLAEAVLKTTAPFRWAYPVEDRLEAVFGSQDLKPQAFSLNIREGKFKKRQKFDFTKTPLGPNTYDFLSVWYALRAAPLAVGRVEKIKVWSDGKTLEMPLRVSGKETVKSGLGKRECFMLSPVNQLMIKGHPVEVKLAITTGPERYPVSFSAHASIATITALLKTASPGRQ